MTARNGDDESYTSFLSSFVQPSPNITYNLISLAYDCASDLTVILYLIERVVLSPHLDKHVGNDGERKETLHELT